MVESMIVKTEWILKYGFEESALLWWIVHWIKKNEADEINFHDGRTWTYNSKKAWSALFPFWTEKQIRRLLDNLIERGAVVTGCYNKQPFDKTLWYSLSNSFQADRSAQTGQSDQPKRANLISPNGPTNTIKENHKEEHEESIDTLLFEASNTMTEKAIKKTVELRSRHYATEDVKRVFDYWNSKSPIKHKKLSNEMADYIAKRIATHGEEELKACINNYCSVITNAASWYTYQSALDDFFRPGKRKPAPCEKFFTERFVLQNFLDKKKIGVVPVNGSRIIDDSNDTRSRIIDDQGGQPWDL